MASVRNSIATSLVWMCAATSGCVRPQETDAHLDDSDPRFDSDVLHDAELEHTDPRREDSDLREDESDPDPSGDDGLFDTDPFVRHDTDPPSNTDTDVSSPTDIPLDTDAPTETDTDRPPGPPALESCPPGTRRTGLTWADATWVANSDVVYDDVLYLLAGLAIGDVDGDGFEDLVFGGNHLPTGDPTDPYDDVIFLRRGPLQPTHEVPDPGFSAVPRQGHFDLLGSILATTDLDGDGRDEIGAGNYEALHVITFDDFASGFSDRGLRSGTVNSRFGDAVCAWPDPTTPGISRFIGGAPDTTTPGGFKEGAMWRVDGIPTGWDTINASTVGWVSTARQAYAGVSIATVGDRDGDGIEDLLVGGVNDAWLVSGASLVPGGGAGVLAALNLDPRIRGLMDYAIVDAAGDLDGDGLRDLLIGFSGLDHEPCDSATPELDTACDAPEAGHPYGLLWRVTGSPVGTVTLTRADAIVSYSALHGRMGRTADAGDLDGDGDHEVLVPLAQRRGDVVLLFDDDAPTAPERLFEGWAYDVRVADLTGDGRPDLVLYGQEDGTRPFLSGGDIGVFELCPAP